MNDKKGNFLFYRSYRYIVIIVEIGGGLRQYVFLDLNLDLIRCSENLD
jgi:hypothetical protein